MIWVNFADQGFDMITLFTPWRIKQIFMRCEFHWMRRQLDSVPT